MTSGAKHPLFWSIVAGVIVLDVVTKQLAVANLTRVPVPVLGDVLQFRLVYNPGAAFGIYVGPYSRWVCSTRPPACSFAPQSGGRRSCSGACS